MALGHSGKSDIENTENYSTCFIFKNPKDLHFSKSISSVSVIFFFFFIELFQEIRTCFVDSEIFPWVGPFVFLRTKTENVLTSKRAGLFQERAKLQEVDRCR